VTCGLEASQLWHPVFLEAVRGSFLGRTLIGMSFAWSDFAYYAIGCLFGVMGTVWMARSSGVQGPFPGGKKNPPTG
jgi:hypothetical protein